ncbi:MAG: insulinase family protein [Chitinophagales bacterium]
MSLLQRLCLPLLLLAGLFSFGQTETSVRDGLHFIKLPNAMNAVIMVQPGAVNTQLSLHIRTGSVYENDSISGVATVLQSIIADRITSYLQRSTGPVTKDNTAFSSFTTSEQTVFQFSGPSAQTLRYLQLLRDSVYFTFVTPEQLKAKAEELTAAYEKQKGEPRRQLETKLMQLVFRTGYDRAISAGNISNYVRLDTAAVNRFHRKYYVAANSLFGVAGSVNTAQFQQDFENTYRTVFRTDFDPETITKIIDFKPMLYSTQFVVEGETDQPEFQLCWQFPGTASGPELAYDAYLVSAILNDYNNFIQVKARKMGCNYLQFQYEPNNFSGLFRVVFRPDKKNLMGTYNFILSELQRLDKTLVNQTMINAGKVKFQKEYAYLTGSNTYPEWTIRYWPFKDESYFSTLNDSIMSVTEDETRRFVIEYLRESPHTSALFISKADRADLGVDTTFIELDANVNNYIFTYRQNVTDIEGEQNQTQLRNLLHWLKLNPDIYVQVNGWADEGEFNKTYDDSIFAFIDSIPTYQKTKPDAVKKRYLRPEMMRAMKIVKYLYDNGIPREHLRGTAMAFKSANRQEAISNMKCTLTLDKLRKPVSLYEYHYGTKPKE